MKKFTVEQYQAAKEVAKELGINFVGKKKEVLVEMVNEELAKKEAAKTTKAAKATKKEKWYANGYGYSNGDQIFIHAKTVVKGGVTKDILKGREAVVIGPSENEGMIKAYLIDEKTGEKQNCPITLEIGKIALIQTIEEKVA